MSSLASCKVADPKHRSGGPATFERVPPSLGKEKESCKDVKAKEQVKVELRIEKQERLRAL